MLLAVIVAFIILILILNSNHSAARKQADDIQVSITLMRKEIKELEAQLKRITVAPKKEEEIQPKKDVIVPAPAAPPVEQKKAPEPILPPALTPAPQKEIPTYTAPPKKQPIIEPVVAKESWFEKWLRNNPDIEKFIGENLINKIGIAVLILGIAFFVKYAIDNDWINKTGRVAIGILCGAILVGLAHRLRKGYRSFSSVLAGGGITVFYFTIAFAFHQYQLLSQPVAFSVMVIITAFAVALSVLYDRIELGVIATIGGFITPFLVSNGSGNYIALFTYLAILNTGLLVLAYYKRWKLINYIAFVSTILIFGGWLADRVYSNKTIPTLNGLMFATIFYFQFVAMQVVNNVREGYKFKALDFSVLLLINVAFYSVGMLLLQDFDNGQWKGLFTICLALINLVMAWVFYKQKRLDKNFIYLLIGLTISFISLTAPVQLKGNYITLFWAAEMVLLFWFYQKTNITLVKIGASIVYFLCILRLVLDWGSVYAMESIPAAAVLLNKGFVTGITVVIAMYLLYRLLKLEANSYYLGVLPNDSVRQFVGVITIIVLFITGFLETNYQAKNHYPGATIHSIWLETYAVLFVLGLLLFIPKMDKVTKLAISLISFLFYVFNMSNIYDNEVNMLVDHQYKSQLLLHWLSAIGMLAIILLNVQNFRKNYQSLKGIQVAFTWIASIALVILLSIEIRNIYVWFNYSNNESLAYYENLFNKAGISIIWGLSSFLFIWLGLRYKFKPLRIFALVLFGTTLVKLFAYDIRNIPPAGKIIAFILLGVVLLTVSFMYQRLKKILIDDSADKNKTIESTNQDQSK